VGAGDSRATSGTVLIVGAQPAPYVWVGRYSCSAADGTVVRVLLLLLLSWSIAAATDVKWRFFWRIGSRPQQTDYPELNAEPVVPQVRRQQQQQQQRQQQQRQQQQRQQGGSLW